MGLSDKEEPSVADLECRRRRGNISGSGRSLFYSKSTAPSKTFFFLAFNRIFHILLKKTAAEKFSPNLKPGGEKKCRNRKSRTKQKKFDLDEIFRRRIFFGPIHLHFFPGACLVNNYGSVNFV